MDVTLLSHHVESQAQLAATLNEPARRRAIGVVAEHAPRSEWGELMMMLGLIDKTDRLRDLT